MRLVIVESPYAGATPADVQRNVVYARAAMTDCLRRGEAPFASHLLYTQPGVLDDTIPEQRRLGIAAGLAWGRVAAMTAVYVDLGVTAGMKAGIDWARREDRPVERRSLLDWERETAVKAQLVRDAGPEPARLPSPQCSGANNARHATRTPAVVEAAKTALAVAGLRRHHREVLVARVEHPDATLAELGDLLDLTKDQVSARLRRALAIAREGVAA